MPVWEVQGFLPRYHTLLSNSLLWYRSWWLWEEERIIELCLYKFGQLVGFWFYQISSTKYLKTKNAVISYACLRSVQRRSIYLLLWTVYGPPVVVLDLLQLVKLHGDVVNGELQQVPEPSQVLRGGPRHGTGILRGARVRGVTNCC